MERDASPAEAAIQLSSSLQPLDIEYYAFVRTRGNLSVAGRSRAGSADIMRTFVLRTVPRILVDRVVSLTRAPALDGPPAWVWTFI